MREKCNASPKLCFYNNLAEQLNWTFNARAMPSQRQAG